MCLEAQECANICCLSENYISRVYLSSHVRSVKQCFASTPKIFLCSEIFKMEKKGIPNGLLLSIQQPKWYSYFYSYKNKILDRVDHSLQVWWCHVNIFAFILCENISKVLNNANGMVYSQTCRLPTPLEYRKLLYHLL